MKKILIKSKNNIKKNTLEEIWQDNKNDPNGSYTGTSLDDDVPVQDADDL